MALQAGSIAPDFTTIDQDNKPVKLSDFRGKKVVLYFYPKDMTPGCTAEACDLRDNYTVLRKQGYEVLGVSTDSAASHQKFIAKEKLPFRLLADTDKKVHTLYQTWVEKSMYGRKYMGTARITYLIDESGKIAEVIEKVDTRNHTSQILGTSAPAKPAKAAPKVAKKKATASKSKSSTTKRKPVKAKKSARKR